MDQARLREGLKMKKYGIVIVGCGYMGTRHAEAVCRHDRTRLAGVVDTDERQARETAERFGVGRWHTDYRAFAKSADADAVIIATYPSTHLEITQCYLAEGKHVLCEKPIAPNLQDARTFCKVSAAAKSRVSVGHILRHNATYQQVIRMIHSGLIGFPLVMRMSQLKQSEHWSGHLALLRDASPIVDCGVHYFDVMRWATGAELQNVSGIGRRLEPDVPAHSYNYGMAAVTMSDGSVGYFEAGWGHTLQSDCRKEFIGPKGRIEIIYQCARPEACRPLGNLIRHYDYATDTCTDLNIPYESNRLADQWDHFVRLMDGTVPPVPSLEDAYAAMRMAALADKAIREGMTAVRPPRLTCGFG